MRNAGLLYAFLGGAIVGAAASILFTPVKGTELRAKIRGILRKRGVKISDEEVDQLVAELAGAIEK